MQKIATRIFIGASLTFGAAGILLVLAGGPDDDSNPINQLLMKILLVSVFIILPSFAVSVAGRYLSGKR